MAFILYVTYPSGTQRTLTFPSAFSRSLWIILLAEQPVTLQLEDRS